MNTKRWKICGYIFLLMLGIITGILGVHNQQARADEPTYTIATNNTFAPFAIQDSQGTYKGKNPGIEIEMLQQIAQHEHFKYTLKPMSFDGDLQALESGQVDAIMAGMSVTDERKQNMIFLVPTILVVL